MVELRRYHGRLTALSQIFARQEEVGGDGVGLSSGVAAAEDPTPSTADSPVHPAKFKPSIPVIVGIVSAVLIFVGLGILAWRWRARIRHIARTNRKFRGSYEKYGLGRGIESSNSTTSHKSNLKATLKDDPNGSFFEVETDKPKKALMLNFTNRRSYESTHTATRSATSHSRSHSNSNSQSHGGWGQPNQFKNGDSYTQRAAPSHPPGLGYTHGGRSARSSFSFSLRKSDSAKRPMKVQHLPNVSSIKSKGISAPAPLIVANGGAEPWSPLPTGLSSNSVHGHSDCHNARDSATLIPSTPVHPPLVTFTPPKHPQQQKLRQPQPRSPPAAPGTSQKRTGNHYEDGDGLRLPLPPQTLISSDGSLYSRNSFCSSDYGLPAGGALQQVSPVPVAAVAPGVAESLSMLTSGVNSVSASGSRPGQTPSNQLPNYTFSSPIYSDGDTLTRGRPPSVSSPSSPSPNTYLPRLMTVIAPFTPTLEDELPLKVGDTVRIIEEYKDEWCMVQMVGRMDSPRGVVPCVCLQERKRLVPVPVNVGSSGR